MSQASVLVVDDEPCVRETLSEWLRIKNFRVIEADGGRQAMERIVSDGPDIVISDIVMPEMDGLQVLEKSKSIGVDVPFLMISGYSSTSAAVKAMKCGAADYLPKPFTPEELVRRVNQTLLQKSASSAHATVRGMVLGAVLSVTLWGFIILAYAAFIS